LPAPCLNYEMNFRLRLLTDSHIGVEKDGFPGAVRTRGNSACRVAERDARDVS
jgi:hypothetical protein